MIGRKDGLLCAILTRRNPDERSIHPSGPQSRPVRPGDSPHPAKGQPDAAARDRGGGQPVPAAVQRRIAALEASGIIVANVAVLAPDALQAAITVVVEVHLQNDRSSIVEPTKALFRSTPEIQQCYYVTGSAGFILVMIVPDMTSYEAISRRLFADNPVVETFRTLVVLDTVKAGLEIVVPDGT